jgi:hypothetical protein
MRRISLLVSLGYWALALWNGVRSPIFAQDARAPLSLYSQKMDSVVLIVYHFFDPEFSELPTSEIGMAANADSTYPVLRCHLDATDANRLRRKMSWPEAYAQAWALPYHYNVGVYYFEDGQIMNEITLSTLTGNITVQKNHCPYDPMIANIQGSKEYSKVFQDMVSKRFARYWIRLLSKYKLWDRVDPGDKLRIGGECGCFVE